MPNVLEIPGGKKREGGEEGREGRDGDSKGGGRKKEKEGRHL